MPHLELSALEPREVPAAFETYPVVPELSPEVLANIRGIAQQGRLNGLRPDVFVKAGDSNTAGRNYLVNLGNPTKTYAAGLPQNLVETLNAYRAPIAGTWNNSFNRSSLAATPGWTSREVAANIGRELDATRAAVAVIMIGTNDTALTSVEEFQQRLESAIQQTISRGVVPVLSTVPHLMYRAPSSADAAKLRNQIIVDLAEKYRIPVLNLWSGLENVPLLGLTRDLVHLSVSPRGSGGLEPIDLAFGQNYRAYTWLQTLDLIRREVLSFDAVALSRQIPEFWNDLQPNAEYLVTGSAAGGPAVITVSDASGQRVAQLKPFEETYLGGVHVAFGDVDGDGYGDVVAAAGLGGGPVVKIYSGRTGQPLANFFAFEPSFRGGVTVAVGDENGDGRAELAVGTGVGGGPRVQVYDNLQLQRDFMALDPNFRGGINVAIGRFGLATSAGDSSGPIVNLFAPGSTESRSAYYAYDANFRGGVNISAADLDKDGESELLTAAGPGGGPHIRIWRVRADQVQELDGFLAEQNDSREGYRVAGTTGQVIVASGSGPNQPVRRYSLFGELLASQEEPGEPWVVNGAFVAAG